MKAFFDRIDTASAIAITLIAALVALTFVLVFHTIPDSVSDVFKLLVGSLLTLAGTIVTFYFGSSSGSKDKDKASADTLKGAVEALSGNPPPPNGSVAGNPAVKAVLALFAILLLSSIFAMPAFAQITKSAPGAKPTNCLALDPRPACKNGVFTPSAAGGPSSGASPSIDPEVACDFHIFIGLTPSNLEQAIKQCVSDVNSTLADDTARALASAVAYPDNDGVNCLKPGLAILQAGMIVPAQPAIDAIPANPNATPPTLAVAAVPAQPAKNPGLILLFQKYREFIISGGLTSCQTWVNMPINATVAQGLNNAGGVVGAAAAATALMPIK